MNKVIPVILALGLLTVSIAKASPEVKVDICHATSSKSNPYVLINVSANSVQNKDAWFNGHGKHEDDIWAQFTLIDGWVVSAQGNQSILKNGCKVPVEPTKTPTETPTKTPTQTKTETPTLPTVTPTVTPTLTPTEKPVVCGETCCDEQTVELRRIATALEKIVDILDRAFPK